MVYPSYFATRLMLFTFINPDRSSSKRSNILLIPAYYKFYYVLCFICHLIWKWFHLRIIRNLFIYLLLIDLQSCWRLLDFSIKSLNFALQILIILGQFFQWPQYRIDWRLLWVILFRLQWVLVFIFSFFVLALLLVFLSLILIMFN